MKTLKNINNVLITFIIVSGVLGCINNGFWMMTSLLLLTMGSFQGITGCILFLLHPKSIRFQLYIGGLLLFVMTCYLPIPNAWMLLPIPLLMYFSFMIHTVHQERHKCKTFKTI
ncbi:MAG: hypothetical protein ACI9Y7_000011 [Dokdonia sp.]|jgi:hypothetical protein